MNNLHINAPKGNQAEATMIAKETISTAMQNLREAVTSIAQSSNKEKVIVEEFQVIGFDTQSAVALLTLLEDSQGNLLEDPGAMPAYPNRTIIMKTADGGESWHQTLSTRGKVVLNELFFLDTSHFWAIAQWQKEGTFPTLYWTADFGETWQESRAIDDFLRDKGHRSVSYAEALRFQSESDGIAIAKGAAPKEKAYFLQTVDGGKSWEEIPELPGWYSQVRGLDWQERNLWRVDDQEWRSS